MTIENKPDEKPDVISRAIEISRATEAAFGGTTGLLYKKRFLVEAVLKAGNVTAGGAVTPQVVVALDAIGDIAALLNSPVPTDALSSMIATGVNAAPMFELYEQAARNVADKARAAAEAAMRDAQEKKAKAEAEAASAAEQKPEEAPPAAPKAAVEADDFDGALRSAREPSPVERAV